MHIHTTMARALLLKLITHAWALSWPKGDAVMANKVYGALPYSLKHNFFTIIKFEGFVVLRVIVISRYNIIHVATFANNHNY